MEREPYEELEARLADWCGVPNVVACSSGTAALHLALEALRLPPGSEVIVPSYTMAACARAVTLAGLTPVLVGCCDDLLADPSLMREAAGPEVRAIMLVHVYGRRSGHGGPPGWPVPSPAMYLIEDLAEAHGLSPGKDTDAACWSFYRNKIVAGEEGGAVAFRDPGHADKARQLRCLGFTAAHDFLHHPRGCNYRMANTLATLVLGSLGRFDDNLAARRELELAYDAYCPDDWRMPRRDAPWVYDLLLPEGTTYGRQGEAVAALRRAGVEARHGFKPLHLQPEYAACKRYPGLESALAPRVIYLPLHPGSTSLRTVETAWGVLRGLYPGHF